MHEAAKRKDLGIIKLVLARGGDVLARDRKGKLPVEVSRDERIKNVLKEGELFLPKLLSFSRNWIINSAFVFVLLC